jgi:hypothetical protein
MDMIISAILGTTDAASRGRSALLLIGLFTAEAIIQ